jgi:hypothetical protein
MNSFSGPANAEEQASAIERKRNLLAYLRSKPQHLTLESYLCLTRILSEAGWRHQQECWTKGSQRHSTLPAVILELESQIAADRDRLLRQTASNYRPATPGP